MCALVVTVLGLVTHAVPEPEGARARLKYETDTPTCPDADGFAASVAARLGYSPFHDDATRTATVVLSSTARGLRGTLELRDGPTRLGRREFTSSTKDCHELASSVSLALAIALDPQHSERPPPVPTPPAAPPPPALVPPAPSPPAPVPATPSSLRVGLGAFGSLSVGLTPRLTGGGGFELAAGWGPLEVVGRGGLDVTDARVDLEVGVVSGSLAACGVTPWVGLCVVGGGSALTLKGPAATATQGVGHLGGRVVGRFEPVRGLWLLPFVELLATLTRVTALAGDEVLWVAPPLSFSAGLSVRYDFFPETSPPRPNTL